MVQSARLSLRVEECDVTGELGFKLLDTPATDGMYIGTTGILIAHDIIEHVNGLQAIGSIADELMALGGIWQVRGQWGDIQRGMYASILSSEQHIAGELPELYWRYHRGVPLRWEPEPGEVIGDIAGQEELYELWEHIEIEGLKIARAEYIDEDLWSFETWSRFCQFGRHLFVKGCLKLDEIWESNLLAANSQFWAIHDEVEDWLHRREDLWVGQEYHLAYGSGACSIVPREDDDDEF